MRETSSTNFLLWQAHLDEEEEQPTREHYYFAQIALEVARVLSDKKGRFKLSEFILPFTRKQEDNGVEASTRQIKKKRKKKRWSKKAAKVASVVPKMFWGALLGVDVLGKKKKEPTDEHGDGN